MRYLIIIFLSFTVQPNILHAMECESIAQDDQLLSDQERLNRKFMDAIYTAIDSCEVENMGDIHDYLQQGAAVDTLTEENRTPLIEVCAKSPSAFERSSINQQDLIALLLEFKANPNHRDSTSLSALEHAASFDNTEAMKLLIAAGADFNGTPHVTPYHVAIFHRASNALELLLSLGATPLNTIDYYGMAPIHYAVDYAWNPYYKKSMLSSILEYGADLDTKTSSPTVAPRSTHVKLYPKDSSPFHLAAQLYTQIRKNCDVFVRKPIVQTKKLLLYHALFYGNINCKSMLSFLCCIKKLAPALYNLRNTLLIPRCKLQPNSHRLMLQSKNYATRAIAVQALIYRAQQLHYILALRDGNGHTAYEIEQLCRPVDVQIDATILLNPETLLADCKAYIEAEREGSLAKLPETNPYKAAWSLISQSETPLSLMPQPEPEKTSRKPICVIC